MKIKRIEVKDLFDYYCYEIAMKEHEAISIVHAPNGYGKTIVFKMITNLLKVDIVGISEVPFNEFVVEFTGGSILRAKKVEEKRRAFLTRFLVLEIENIETEKQEKKSYSFEVPISEHILDRIREEGFDEYIRRIEMRRRRISIEEREESENIQNRYEKFVEQLRTIRKAIGVNFIDSDRLFSTTQQMKVREVIRKDKYGRDEIVGIRHDGRMEDYSEQSNRNENIIRDAKDILYRIQKARQIYSLESEKRDRNFPDRLVQYVNSQTEFFDDIQIAEQLEELEKKRLELENAGLVLSGKKTLAPGTTLVMA